MPRANPPAHQPAAPIAMQVDPNQIGANAGSNRLATHPASNANAVAGPNGNGCQRAFARRSDGNARRGLGIAMTMPAACRLASAEWISGKRNPESELSEV